MREFKKPSGRIVEDGERFDIEFWQRGGERALFAAALDMILDYLTIRHGHANQPRLQRTVESFGKIDVKKLKNENH